jgi:nitrate/nitrite transport system permease protein
MSISLTAIPASGSPPRSFVPLPDTGSPVPARISGPAREKPAPVADAAAARPQDRIAVDRRFETMVEKLRPLTLAILLPTITFLIVLGAWLFVHQEIAPDFPSPAATFEHGVEMLSDPFYDHGPNDKGVGYQLLYSIGRVLMGFGIAVAVAIPIGILMGLSRTFDQSWQPLIQILRPVSPLAWLPIGLLLFKAVDPSAIFVIFITSIWPTLLNTAAGVRAIPQDYMNVARVLRLSRTELLFKVVLPAIRPYVITGMKLSLGIAWMVIVAAEMLTGGVGIGFYIWDEWNNLKVESIIVAILLIGLVGIVFDLIMTLIQNRFDYERK